MMTLNSLFGRFEPITQDMSRQLDMMRGFGTVVVLSAHAYLLFLYPVWPSLMVPLYLAGHAWVMAFFALSGFLICKSACYNIQQNGTFSVRRYAVSRTRRIVPPLYTGCAVLLVLWLISPWFFATGSRDLLVISDTMSRAAMQLDAESLAGVMLFVNGFITDTPPANFAFWSLSFEVWFYTLFGLLLWPGRRVAQVAALCLLIVLSVLNVAFLFYTLVWISGAATALLHNHQYRLPRRILILFFLTVTLLLTAAAITGALLITGAAQKQTLMLALYGTLAGLIFCFLFYQMSFQRLRIILPGYRFAATSYSIYILHFPLLLFICGIAQPYLYHSHTVLLLFTAAAAGLVLLAGHLAGRVIERRYAKNG